MKYLMVDAQEIKYNLITFLTIWSFKWMNEKY